MSVTIHESVTKNLEERYSYWADGLVSRDEFVATIEALQASRFGITLQIPVEAEIHHGYHRFEEPDADGFKLLIPAQIKKLAAHDRYLLV